MSNMFRVGDELPPLKHTATPFQLFRYSAVTWNPHRIHFDEHYAREEGHAGVALHSPSGRHSLCAASPRASAPAGTSLTSPTVCASPLELIEQQPSGEVGFEGTV